MTGGRADGPIAGEGLTRRDVVNGALAGAGLVLAHRVCPAAAQAGPADAGSAKDAKAAAEWNGPGGVGDYRASNGNTWQTMGSAHQIRDQAYDGALADVVETGERYDLVIVGGGFAGLGALHAFRKRYPNGTCLLIDNQEVFGGYGKANEFDVDGYRIAGPQASLNFILPETQEERDSGYWSDLGLPESFGFAERTGGDPAVKFAKSTSAPLYHGEQSATVGYYFGTGVAQGKGRWVKDVWDGDLARAPMSPAFKRGLLALRDRKLRGKLDLMEAERLDTMTFADFATRELKLDPAVLPYITLGMCQTGPQISAYAARTAPMVDRYAPGSPAAALADRFISFPGGNTTLARYFVKAAIPDAFAGPSTLSAIANNPINFAALDRAGAACRIRLRATAVRVKDEGSEAGIVYERGGKLYRVKADAVVLGIGSWIAKHVVADLPPARREVLDQFLYAPMLMINVALRNWRFLDRLGISTARWFDGFGFYANIRRPMVIEGATAPFHPDKPIVMTFYVPIQNPELPIEAQGPAGRAQLFGTSYADYEKQVVDQMQRLFGAAGFDARRDVAGIVLNRWGHAFVTPQPGFFFGKDGVPSPLKAAAEPLGRIAFGQSGLEDWVGAANAGKRAVTQLGAFLERGRPASPSPA